MPRRVLPAVLVLACLSLLPAAAAADRRYFVDSYTPYLAPAGELVAWSRILDDTEILVAMNLDGAPRQDFQQFAHQRNVAGTRTGTGMECSHRVTTRRMPITASAKPMRYCQLMPSRKTRMPSVAAIWSKSTAGNSPCRQRNVACVLTMRLGTCPARVEVELNGTEFQRRVWEALRRVRAGRTASYSEIARAIGAPAAAVL